MSEPEDFIVRPAASEAPREAGHAEFQRQSQIDFDIAFYEAIVERGSDYVDVLRCLGELLSRRGLHERALAIDRRLANLAPGDCVVQYNLACSLALGGFDDEALAALKAAFNAGYRDFAHLAEDRDLDSLRDKPAFRALLRRYAAGRHN
jgi:hypothetical protein